MRDPPFLKRRVVLYRPKAAEDSPQKYQAVAAAFKKRGDGMLRLVDYAQRP